MEDLRRLLEQERERREQIERLARAKEEFVQVLSHELRTPLTVISGALRMIRGRAPSPEDAAIVDSAIRRVGELEFLVEGLELVGSGPKGQGLAHVKDAVESAAARLGLTLDTVRFQDETWKGIPHPYVERVAFELLSNAVRHGRRPIEITARREGSQGVVRVTDAGGWAPAFSDFSAFHQEDMSATRSAGGFGLGLFLVSRLCQACQGELSIRAAGGRTVAEARFRLSA
jgi:signal transduction histidine kinase